MAIGFRAFKSHILWRGREGGREGRRGLPFFIVKNLVDELRTQRLCAHQITLPSVDCSSLHCLYPHKTEITPGTVKTGHYDNTAHQLCSCKSLTKSR